MNIICFQTISVISVIQMQLKCEKISLASITSPLLESRCIVYLVKIKAILLPGSITPSNNQWGEDKLIVFYSSLYDLFRLDFGPFYNAKPTLIKGDGDGTVNRRSLIACQYWENTQAQGDHAVYQQEFPGIEHYNMLSNAGPINYILDKLTGIADFPRAYEYSGNDNTMKIRLF